MYELVGFPSWVKVWPAFRNPGAHLGHALFLVGPHQMNGVVVVDLLSPHTKCVAVADERPLLHPERNGVPR